MDNYQDQTLTCKDCSAEPFTRGSRPSTPKGPCFTVQTLPIGVNKIGPRAEEASAADAAQRPRPRSCSARGATVPLPSQNGNRCIAGIVSEVPPGLQANKKQKCVRQAPD
jgi:hypothetical protein